MLERSVLIEMFYIYQESKSIFQSKFEALSLNNICTRTHLYVYMMAAFEKLKSVILFLLLARHRMEVERNRNRETAEQRFSEWSVSQRPCPHGGKK